MYACKKLLTAAFFILSPFASSYAQMENADTSVQKETNLRNKVLQDIQQGLNSRTKVLDSTVANLDKRVSILDQSISTTKDIQDKTSKLIERVQVVEDRQKALDLTELNIFQANYQSAIVNLVSMDREIKPLVLFNTTKSFFTSLSNAANPMQYDGYTSWYKGFSTYLNENKSKSPLLSVTSSLLGFAKGFTAGVPVTGPITTSLFSGMTSYIDNMGKKEKDLKEQSEKMLTLTMKISQFAYDNGQIENEWDAISKELDDLQKKYESSLKTSLGVLKVSETDFKDNFTNQNDADKRYLYLTGLRDGAASFVTNQKKNNPKDWKQQTNVQLLEVQNLRLRFGQITFRIQENIKKYNDLFEKYKSDDQIGTKIKELQIKLKDLEESFDKTFDPMEYINSANKMYRV